MATPVEMPKLGNTVEECLLTRWCKRPGDAVKEGETIAEIETDKATFELTAPADGTLLGTFFQDGELVPVYANVCVVGSPGESIEGFKPQAAPAVPASRPQEAAAPQKQVGAAVKAAGVPSSMPAAAWSPRARRFAREHDFAPGSVRGTGSGGRVMKEDLRQLYCESPRVSSLARKMMESGCEIRGEGSGANGMVLSRDLTAAPDKMPPVRARIAQRMRDSLATTAQYTMNTSAAATGLLSLRARFKKHPQEAVRSVNINDMVMFCAIRALEAVPEVNAELVDGKVYRHAGIHIGFACDTPKGLLVPVIRDSQTLTLPQLSLKIKSLTQQASEGSIMPDDLSGGTFTVSNLGMFGITSFTPLLNAPQVAILGVNSIELKPVRGKKRVEYVEHIGLSLTCDHQVIDGAPGARFLKTVREQIENIEEIAGIEL